MKGVAVDQELQFPAISISTLTFVKSGTLPEEPKKYTTLISIRNGFLTREDALIWFCEAWSAASRPQL